MHVEDLDPARPDIRELDLQPQVHFGESNQYRPYKYG